MTFALVGLFLQVEHGFSGREVQRVHMELARKKRDWPRVKLPADRGAITAVEVLRAAEGAERDRAIHEWCAAIWSAFVANREQVVALLAEHRIQF